MTNCEYCNEPDAKTVLTHVGVKHFFCDLGCTLTKLLKWKVV